MTWTNFSCFVSFYTLRGVSAEWLFCDETAFMNKAVYHEIVIPLFEMRNACLICISSPLGQFNFYSALIALKDPRTGKSVIDSYHLKLVCDRCMKKEHPEYCTHEREKIPPWKSSDKLDIVKLIMEVGIEYDIVVSLFLFLRLERYDLERCCRFF